MVAERFDDWVQFPQEASLKRQDSYFVQLINKLRRVSDRVQAVETANTATQAEVDALETATASLSDGTSSIAFATNVANYGAGYEPLSCFKTRDGMVHVYGLIRNNTGAGIADGSVIAQLPTGWRPPLDNLSGGQTSVGHVRIDIEDNGQIYTRGFTWNNADFLWIHATFKAA